MTFEQAIAAQPFWVQIWLNILVIGAFLPPVLMLFWKSSRMAGIVTIVVNIIAAFGVSWMFTKMGYVKLLGLPHILLWTPLLVYLIWTLRNKDLPTIPKWLIRITALILLISLLFDYTDAIRYLLGDRTPL